MKSAPALLPLSLLALLLSACAGPEAPQPEGYLPPRITPTSGAYYPSEPPRYTPPRPLPPQSSDYLPHLSAEYRNGYDIGAKDRSFGYPRDHARAYARFGGGYASYFQEGYADGYDGGGMRH